MIKPAHRNRLAPLALGVLLFTACGSRIPARIVTLEGRGIEVATAGSGGAATVVFEAGLGDDWTAWDGVASDVATQARVFAYSRPGYGASDRATTPRDPRRIVEELRALLASQGYAPPYLLVGHSFGGTYMELFARAHPSEVIGLVLVDTRHRDFLERCEAARLDACGITEKELAEQPASLIAEYRAFPMASPEIQEAGPFGEAPVRVLTATRIAGSAARQALWRKLAASLADEAPDGERVLVERAGHYVQLDRADAVVHAILSLLPRNG